MSCRHTETTTEESYFWVLTNPERVAKLMVWIDPHHQVDRRSRGEEYQRVENPWVYAHRAARRYSDHSYSGCDPISGLPAGAPEGQDHAMSERPAADVLCCDNVSGRQLRLLPGPLVENTRLHDDSRENTSDFGPALLARRCDQVYQELAASALHRALQRP